ncbi:hypothetical protein IFM89_002127 [Coptis chinensis]|uniref:Uncharacterized protein n=1 Tax=Coptis chinensis TaxID=261450 RepID=A0A835LG30_9MAGN|nr:hypothetical protein IFM89_002127 [Coptis chinensis]
MQPTERAFVKALLSPESEHAVVQHEGCDWLFALIGGTGTNYKHLLCNLGGIRRHHKKNTASYTKLMHYSLVVMNSDGEMVIVNKCPLID